MGGVFSKKKEVRILVLGLDGAGKSTMIGKLKNNNIQRFNPTIGFNVETYKNKRNKFNLWDVGGQDSIRPLWRHYYTGAQALLFVVDSADRDRFSLAKSELYNVISDPEMKDSIILILANKQDLNNAATPEEIAEELNLKSISTHKWNIMSICATKKEGVEDALDWLSTEFSAK